MLLIGHKLLKIQIIQFINLEENKIHVILKFNLCKGKTILVDIKNIFINKLN